MRTLGFIVMALAIVASWVWSDNETVVGVATTVWLVGLLLVLALAFGVISPGRGR